MKYIVKFAIALSAILMAVGCEDKIVTDKGSTPLEVQLSSGDIVCDQVRDNQVALEIAWTSGTNMGTGASIKYFFEFDVAGNDFKGGLKSDLGKLTSRSITFTHKELNDTLLNYFGAEEKIPAEYEIRITATVNDASVPQQVATGRVSITPYQFQVMRIYMVGDATPGGWNNQSATELLSDGTGIFTWEGMLNPGEVKFLVKVGSWFPCYVSDTENSPIGDECSGVMLYRTEKDEETIQDNKWIIPVKGYYRMVLHRHEGTTPGSISIENMEGPAKYDKLWLVSENDTIPFLADPKDPYSFKFAGNLPAGRYVISSKGTGSLVGVAGYSVQQSTTTNGTFRVEEVEDVDACTAKIGLQEPNKYTISLDLRTMYVEVSGFKPYKKLWMIGDATPGGWNWDNVTEMTVNPTNENVFEADIEVEIPGVEIKFPTEINTSWSGEFLLAPVADCEPTEDGTFVVGNQPDNKWVFHVSGKFHIRIDLYNETISFTKTN